MAESAIIAAVRKYLAALPAEGVHASRGILYGSFARDAAHEWSDIDLVVIAPEFDGRKDIALVKALWRATAHADNRIEPIPCGEREWETDGSRPILEIARREGVTIHV
jgi:hypothetical protein